MQETTGLGLTREGIQFNGRNNGNEPHMWRGLRVSCQGNRISTLEDPQQVLVVPASLQAFGPQTALGCVLLLEQIERQVA